MSVDQEEKETPMTPEQRDAANIKLAVTLGLVAVGIYVVYILIHL